VLVVVGWFLYLTLIRLRQAWGESALAMNQIKAFFARHPKGAAEGNIWAALRWRVETLPPLDRKWNVYHYSAILLNLLNGVALACGALLINTKALQVDSARGPLIGGAVALGLAMMAYGCGMYRVFLCPPPIAQDAKLKRDKQAMSPMPNRVEIGPGERVYDGFFKIDSAQVSYERFDGSMSPPTTRLVFERGDSVAVLPFDPKRREVVLVKQFRYPAYVRNGPGWLWEIIAGMQDGGRDAETVARSEAMEEAGYKLGEMHKIMTIYPSPGGSSERLHIYLAPVARCEQVAKGGGLPESGEDILVRTFDLDEALEMIEAEDYMDAKTALALEYLKAHWDELSKTSC